MTWKTAFIICCGLSLAAESHAQSRLSESSFNTFVTDGRDLRDRITLAGEPNRRQLDALLPANVTKMFRVVLTCAVDKARMPTRCRRDRSFPDQFGDVAVAIEALKGSSVSKPDAAHISEKSFRLQVVVYLDDPTRSLDRYNPWTVSTPAP
jgi:hypothetical protein